MESSCPAEAESGCRVGGAEMMGTSHNQSCMEAVDLS